MNIIIKINSVLKNLDSRRVAEWFNAHRWKRCVRENVPRVRISSLLLSKFLQVYYLKIQCTYQ